MKRIAASLLMLLISGCGSSPTFQPVPLDPVAGPAASTDVPAIVLGYEGDFSSLYKDKVPLGAEIVAVDDTSIHSINDLMYAVTNAYRTSKPPKMVTLKKDENSSSVPADVILDSSQRKTRVTLMKHDAAAIMTNNDLHPPAKLIVQAKGSYLIKQSAVYWPTNPPLLAVTGYYHAANNCNNCRLDNVTVRDTATQEELVSMPNIQAISLLYPSQGGHASVNNPLAHNYDSYKNQQPSTDGLNERIELENAKGRSAVTKLVNGNLTTGPLAPMHPKTGTIFFRVPAGSKGPYVVTTLLGNTTNTFTFERP